MEVKRLNSVPFAIERIVCSVITPSLTVETAMAAQKALVSLLFLIGSLPTDADMFSNVLDTEKRFPFGDLTRVSRPGPENKDASETEDDDDNKDEDASDGDDNDENGDDSGEEGSDDDDETDPDDDSEANGYGESDDDEDDDVNEEDDDEDDDVNDEDDDEDDDEEEELARPPFKKKK